MIPGAGRLTGFHAGNLHDVAPTQGFAVPVQLLGTDMVNVLAFHFSFGSVPDLFLTSYLF